MFCKHCGRQAPQGFDTCNDCNRDNGGKKPSSNPALHITAISLAPIIFFVWGAFGGDPDLYEVNAVDWVCAVISLALLLMSCICFRKAHIALRVVAIVLTALVTLFTVGWLCMPLLVPYM